MKGRNMDLNEDNFTILKYYFFCRTVAKPIEHQVTYYDFYENIIIHHSNFVVVKKLGYNIIIIPTNIKLNSICIVYYIKVQQTRCLCTSLL